MCNTGNGNGVLIGRMRFFRIHLCRTRDETEVEAETEAEAPAEAEATAETEATADATYTNKGYTLTVPAKYDDLLFTTTPEEEGVLFICSEIASIEAAQKQGMDYDGVGRLFNIQTVDEATFNQMLCNDMSGVVPFGTDGNGTYFLLIHPTDVTLVRENYDNPEDMEIWTELNEWAATVPDTFLSDNPQLTAAKYGNTELDMYLARIAFEDGVNYTISTTEFLELEPKDVDPAPYLEKLRNNVTYEPVNEEAPDGEYVVLNFPDDNIRFDFFFLLPSPAAAFLHQKENSRFVLKNENVPVAILFSESSYTETENTIIVFPWCISSATARSFLVPLADARKCRPPSKVGAVIPYEEAAFPTVTSAKV